MVVVDRRGPALSRPRAIHDDCPLLCTAWDSLGLEEPDRSALSNVSCDGLDECRTRWRWRRLLIPPAGGLVAPETGGNPLARALPDIGRLIAAIACIARHVERRKELDSARCSPYAT